MDIRSSGYFASLRVSGLSDSRNYEGSISEIIRQIMVDLVGINLRINAQGQKSIEISISNVSRSVGSEVTMIQKMAKEIESQLVYEINPNDFPRENESYDSYVMRQITEESCTPTTAYYMAQEHFGIEMPEIHRKWLSDSKVERFIQLQSSTKSYQSALPNEYRELMNYIKSEYPWMAENINWKEA